MALLDELRAKRDEIYAIAEPYGISNIRVFGSVARGEETPESDIDFLVDYIPGYDPLGFVDFQHSVGTLTNREIDIVFRRGVHPLLKDIIANEAMPL